MTPELLTFPPHIFYNCQIHDVVFSLAGCRVILYIRGVSIIVKDSKMVSLVTFYNKIVDHFLSSNVNQTKPKF